MDRMTCTLVYSDYSIECQKLGGKLRALEFDFSNVTGMALLNVDSPQARKRTLECGIEVVPTLIMRFYDGREERLVGEDIHRWVNSVTHDLQTFARKLTTDSSGSAAASNDDGPAIQFAYAKKPGDDDVDNNSKNRNAYSTSSSSSSGGETRNTRTLLDTANQMQLERDLTDKSNDPANRAIMSRR